MESHTRAIAALLRYADKHRAPPSFVAELWRLRAEPEEVQADRLHELYGVLHGAHRTAVAHGQ
jgi:hypothetical protein